MATNIGRVEFIVGLDGKGLAAEANRLGNSVGDAGSDAGDKFGKNFKSSFDRHLSGIGKNFANEMRKTGDLAGESLGTSIERKVKASFARMQDNLAEVLTNDEAFKKYALGFDTVDDAVKQLEADMGELHKANRLYRDEQGKIQSDTILYKKDLDGLTETIRERGKATQESIDRDKQWALEVEQLDADIARMMRTIGNTDDFERASEAVGGTAIKYQQLRDEIDNLRAANKLSIAQQEKAIDTLDRTREKVDANADALIAASIASDEAKEATRRLDKATADIGRTMGDSRTFNERATALGSLSKATKEASDAIDNLKNLGASETRIEGLQRKLKGLHDEFDSGKDRPSIWMRIMDKAANKVQSSWQRMDGTVKLVIGTILSAGPTVAALGSAVGSGLVAVGGAATSMVIGVLGAVAVLKNLNQELDKAPDAMKPAIRSFNTFKDTLGEVSKVIAQSAFDSMGDAFLVLSKNVKALEPALGKVGTALGKLTKGFADGTREGTDAFKEIQKAIDNTAPNLEKLGGIAGTFGTALFRAFNAAQPMVEQLLGWLGKLATGFDTFTKDADAMGEWIDNGMRIWSAFGGVLDAVAETLSNLVTPDAVDNTVKLLENLERLAPSLGNILAVFGALDPIGLLVDIFADIGEALAPLTPMLVFFAQALNNVVEAVPPPVWVALAAGIGLVAAKMVQLKLATVVGPALEALAPTFSRMFGTLKPLPDALGNTSKGLSTLGKAGVIGAVVVGFVALLDVVKDWSRELAGIDDTVKKAVKGNQSLIDTIDELAGVAQGLTPPFEDADGALENLHRWQNSNLFTNIAAGLATAFDKGVSGAHDLNAALNELDNGMQDLPLEDQQKKFAGWAKELDATDAEVLQMLDSMPKYKDAVEDAALAEDGHASKADMVRIALGELGPAAEGSADALAGMSSALDEGASGAELQAAALELLTGKTLGALDAVEGVAEGITTLGSAFRSQQDATIGYQESLTGLNDSLSENGKAWGTSSEAGIANMKAVMDLADQTLNLASQNYNLTGSAEEAAASIQTGRDAVIKAVEGMDLGGLSAEEYADKLGLIPGDVDTLISANTSAGMEMADAFATRLYDLGLIEVNPVLALDAVNAQAEAEKIQGQLDGLTLNSYVTQLDANGDPISGVVEDTSRKLNEFTMTPYAATLTADGGQATTIVDGLNASMAAYDASTHTTQLDANGDPAKNKMDAAINQANKFGQLEPMPTLDVDPNPANTKTDATKNKMNALGNTTFVPKLDANNSQANSKTSATNRQLDALGNEVFTPKILVDNTKATDKTKATADALDKIDSKVATPKINVDNSNALSGAEAVKRSVDNLGNKTIYITTVHRSVSQDARAAGGIASQATLSWWGEAGPEALVPLNRPLSQVDPSVRMLSAVAQGLAPISAAVGSGGGGGSASSAGSTRIVNVQPGAIVVQGDRSPEATATNVVNRMAQRIAG